MLTSSKFMHGIRLAWAASLSLFFMLNLNQFLFSTGLGPEPKYWVFVAPAITAILFLPARRAGNIWRLPLTWWTLGYLFISILWIGFFYTPIASYNGIVEVVTACTYIAVAMLIYPQFSTSNAWWGAVLWLALTLGVASVVLEYFFPVFFIFSEAGQGIIGRAAGFYLNPNIAAQGFLLILACLLARGTNLQKLSASALTLFGLLLTMSRGGLMAWLLLVTLSTLKGGISRWFLAVLSGAVALAWLFAPFILNAASAWIPDENAINRLAWILGEGNLTDFAANEREDVARFGWEMFAGSPFFGHGIGYMDVWAQPVGTHNMILRHLVEYGVLGVFIFPFFIITSALSTSVRSDKQWIWMAATVVFFWSLFTHDMLTQPNFIITWLALCLMQSSYVRS